MMLDEIVAATRARLPGLHRRADAVRAAAGSAGPHPSFAEALRAEGLSVVAEVKRRSPSRGDLAPDLDPFVQAGAYATGGAAAISVLTETDYFAGSMADLKAVAGAVPVPVLRKDFIVDPLQVWEAAAGGAAAVLLITAVLDDAELSSLIAEAGRADLDALVEVHTEAEAHRAMAAGARVVGVNNRDLDDFSVDLTTAERIAPLIVDAAVTVAESGVFTGLDAARMGAAGYDAVLVGEALVVADDPAGLVAELRGDDDLVF
ncbi:indole-3-glycerol phosphate synthase TrpC [soil metagenome]